MLTPPERSRSIWALPKPHQVLPLWYKYKIQSGGYMLSDQVHLSGGSPQGSILGCYLYCSTTQHLNVGLPRPRTALPPPDLDPGDSLDSPPSSPALVSYYGLWTSHLTGTPLARPQHKPRKITCLRILILILRLKTKRRCMVSRTSTILCW